MLSHPRSPAAPADQASAIAPCTACAALAGLGVTQLFDHMADGLVREGKLVAVLGDEIADGPDVHAVCAPGRRAAARIRAAFEAFADAFAPSPR